MKIFWAIVGLLLLVGVGYLAFGRGGKDTPLVNAKPAPEIAPPMNYGVPWDESAFFEGDASTLPATQPESPARPASGTPDNTTKSAKPAVQAAPETEKHNSPSDAKNDTPPPPAAKPTESKPAPPATASASTKPDTAKPASVPTEKKDPASGGAAVPVPARDAPTDASKDAAAPKDAKLDTTEYKAFKQDDGSLLVDDKYTVRGSGTKDDPYQITWEYLTSAEEVYQPRLGKKTLPGRLMMLSDHYVKISGYIAFPIMATEPTEMLTMLNQWDGCCIGVPPSPYDAIEVKLKNAAEGEERLASFGAVSGKLKVEPYLVKNWLVSLYMMEEGEITKK